MAETRVGYWYATGPADKQYTSGDPEFNLHTVISDTSQFVAHVTVENAGEQRFPVPCSLIDEIAAQARSTPTPSRSSSRCRKPPLCEAPPQNSSAESRPRLSFQSFSNRSLA